MFGLLYVCSDGRSLLLFDGVSVSSVPAGREHSSHRRYVRSHKNRRGSTEAEGITGVVSH